MILPPEPLSYLSTSLQPHCHFSGPGTIISCSVYCKSLSAYFPASGQHISHYCSQEVLPGIKSDCGAPFIHPSLPWDKNQTPSHGRSGSSFSPAPSLFATSLQSFAFSECFLMPLGLCTCSAFCPQHTLPCSPLPFAYSCSPQGPSWDPASSRNPSLGSQASLGAHASPLRDHSPICLLSCTEL